MKLNRRAFIGTGVAAAAALQAPMVWSQGRARVVVIGGGAGGATVARYLAKDSQGQIDVTLVEPTRHYYTCFFSNLYIGGFRDIASIGHDRLVLSPGIDFVDGSVPGWDVSVQHKMPHAYKAGSQSELLKAQIEAMPQGGRFAMVAPPNPFRCPPGPYERISMVAHLLTQVNPTAKILLVDPKEQFSKQALFEEGWQKHYGGMIERIGPDFGGDKVEVRADTMEVVIDGTAEKVDVCNVIPGQKAGRICEIAGVTDGNWAPVTGFTMQSRIDPTVYVLGDATAQGDMPKSGYSANSQAKVAAMAIRGELLGSSVFPAKFSNTCWSLIAPEDGVKVGAAYEPTEEKIASVSSLISQTGEDAALRKQTYEESLGWYSGIVADMFG
jgi:NADPH-dependent 2,4-dienoyl-CoA reductase/sulfur reductase-like enzyme